MWTPKCELVCIAAINSSEQVCCSDRTASFFMPPPLICGGIKRWCCLTSDVCLSHTSGLSREQRGLGRLIGTEVAHVTSDSDTTFKDKRSGSPGCFAHRRLGASGGCSGGRGNVLAVGNCCYVAVCMAAQGASAPTVGGEGRGHIVAAARLQLVYLRSSFQHYAT